MKYFLQEASASWGKRCSEAGRTPAAAVRRLGAVARRHSALPYSLTAKLLSAEENTVHSSWQPFPAHAEINSADTITSVFFVVCAILLVILTGGVAYLRCEPLQQHSHGSPGGNCRKS